MKKHILLYILLLISFISIGQSKQFEIYWNDIDQQKGKTSTQNISKKYSPGLIDLLIDQDMNYYIQWEDTNYVDEKSLEISNIRYDNLSSHELKIAQKELLLDKHISVLKSGKARNKLYSSISINPIIKVNGVYKKIISFKVSYNYDNLNRPQKVSSLSNSVLASGDWYKFKVDQTGVYRINKSFLNSIGMNTNNVDPRTIKIYGNGGKALPFKNEDNNEFDLIENSIQIVGEEDGSFDSNDFILFYGVGTKGYQGEHFDTNINPYSDQSFYYVTSGVDFGNRIQQMPEPSGEATTIIDRYNSYKFFESDEFNPAKVGRRWLGNRFDIESEQSFTLDFPNIVPGELMNVKIRVASASETTTSMAISINGTSLDPLIFRPIDDPRLLDAKEFTGDIPSGNENIVFNLIYNNGANPSSIGYLDYISVDALVFLKGNNKQMSFKWNRAGLESGIGEYQISNASQFSQVWDITNPRLISSKTNTANALFSFKANLGEPRAYVAVNPTNYYDPIKINQSYVPNQNLKGTVFEDESGNFKDIDYLIVTPPSLFQAASRLADHRFREDGIHIKVVATNQIYEEFSSGKQDIAAIRNFVKYIYDNASSEENRIKYLCLFGDTSYDYKNRISNNNNMVPTFHLLASENTYTSFMSDDFYGNMDPQEGLMLGPEKLDIAVGRILADDLVLANTMVDKIIKYDSKETFGNWRNDFVLVSDDGDTWTDAGLQFNLDELGDEISVRKPTFNVKKLHSDSFQQIASAGGDRYPDVNNEFENAIETGALIIDYLGHGGEDGLASEFIFTKETAQNLKNNNKLTCMITVTCEFTKFDNPQRITAGELFYWNEDGGAIALVTTTRSISVPVAIQFNDDLAPELFGFNVDVPATPAEAVRIAKNSSNSTNRNVIFYIGDPSMHLAFPKPKIELRSVNGVLLEEFTGVLKALDKVKLGGEIQNNNGNILADYNGVLEVKLFDKEIERSTLGNDGTTFQNSDELIIMDFTTLGGVLFNGKATVSEGVFEIEFIMPRDTQIPEGRGRISLYSQQNNSFNDQTGYSSRITIGGINEDAPEDNQGPLINLFMNDESFVSGGVTNNTPILIAKLSDENGINTASGIGHDMIAILDGDESNPFVINDYYQADVDDYSNGTASFTLRDLEEGLHTVTFKAWDVYNNSSTSEIQFVVTGNDDLKITNVLNYPNPFVDYTEFWFNHNRPFEPLEVQIQVFTVTGKVVWTKNQIISTDGFLSRDIVWDGKDDFGESVGKGVYVYKLTVNSTLTSKRAEKYEKLVIL
jgi:hypothetical protein